LPPGPFSFFIALPALQRLVVNTFIHKAFYDGRITPSIDAFHSFTEENVESFSTCAKYLANFRGAVQFRWNLVAQGGVEQGMEPLVGAGRVGITHCVHVPILE
jgi:hypothetical protein